MNNFFVKTNLKEFVRTVLIAIGLSCSLSMFGQSDSTATPVEDWLLDKTYQWKEVKSDTGRWLVLVAPYSSTTQKGLRGTLTFLVDKQVDATRPQRIHVIFGEKINASKMIDLHFLTDKENGEEKSISLAVTRTDKTKSFSTLSAVNGLSTDIATGQQADLFALFSSYDMLTVYFFVKQVKMRSLVPMKWFRIQYAEP